MPWGSLDKVSPTFIQQNDAVLSQANPVSTTVYSVLTTKSNARISSIYVKVTGANATPLTVTVTKDGIAEVHTVNPGVDGTAYFCGTDVDAAYTSQALATSLTTANCILFPFTAEAQSIAVSAVCTHAGGITSLDVRVKWSQKERS